MNKDRQRKLEARARRQASLANAYPMPKQEPTPVIESKPEAIAPAIGKSKREQPRPLKTKEHLKVAKKSVKLSKGKEKSK